MADPQHLSSGIGPAACPAPKLELLGQIGRGLTGQWRIARAEAVAPSAMASGTGGQIARGITVMKQGIGRDGSRAPQTKWQVPIVCRDCKPLARGQSTGNPLHGRVVTPPVSKGLHLASQVTGIEAGQTRYGHAIAAPIKAMTGETGVLGACPRPAERDEFTCRGEAIVGRSGGRAASQQQGKTAAEVEEARHVSFSTVRPGIRFRTFVACLCLASCRPPPEDRQFMAGADPDAGLAAIERAGCGSCHEIPGLSWPQGKVGPHLGGMAGRALIAGKLPNRPDHLAAFVRNAPALVPGSTMPAMPVSERESHDIVAYLYQLEAN